MNGKHIAFCTLASVLALSAFRASADGAATFGARVSVNDSVSGLDPLACVPVSEPASTDAPGGVWQCAVNCSAQVAVSGDPGNAELLITDDGVPVGSSGRTFNINMTHSPMAISTTIMTTFSDTSDPDTLCCAAQEVGITDIHVNDSSISVVCTDLP